MKLKARFTNRKILSAEALDILRLSIPISVNRSAGQLAVILLIALLGLSNTEDLASFSLAISLMAVPFSFSSIISVGVQNQAAQNGTDTEALASTLRSGLILSLGTGIALFLISRTGINPFEIIDDSGNLSESSYQIYSILCVALPISSTASCLGFYLEGTGRARFTSFVTLAISTVKIILAYTLIFDLFNTNINPAVGAAIAIVASDLLALTLLSIHIIEKDSEIRKKIFSYHKEDLARIKHLLKIGTPSSLGFCLQKLAFSTIAFVVASFGENQIAAYTIILNTVTLFSIPLIGIAHANSILTSKLTGQSSHEEPIKYYYASLAITLSYISIIAIVYAQLLKPITSLFSSDYDVTFIIKGSIIGSATLFFGQSLFSITISYLRAFSDTLKPQAITSTLLYFFAIPIIYLHSNYSSEPNINTTNIALGSTLIITFIILHRRAYKLSNNTFSTLSAI